MILPDVPTPVCLLTIWSTATGVAVFSTPWRKFTPPNTPEIHPHRLFHPEKPSAIGRAKFALVRILATSTGRFLFYLLAFGLPLVLFIFVCLSGWKSREGDTCVPGNQGSNLKNLRSRVDFRGDTAQNNCTGFFGATSNLVATCHTNSFFTVWETASFWPVRLRVGLFVPRPYATIDFFEGACDAFA